mmetsp:Transcript_47556/g.101046  ORF Transcript_47556/g.101046 Transcript_47556/m.101046 type:complete len:317 (-) Transcript_47556:1228-2178(-)
MVCDGVHWEIIQETIGGRNGKNFDVRFRVRDASGRARRRFAAGGIYFDLFNIFVAGLVQLCHDPFLYLVRVEDIYQRVGNDAHRSGVPIPYRPAHGQATRASCCWVRVQNASGSLAGIREAVRQVHSPAHVFHAIAFRREVRLVLPRSIHDCRDCFLVAAPPRRRRDVHAHEGPTVPSVRDVDPRPQLEDRARRAPPRRVGRRRGVELEERVAEDLADVVIPPSSIRLAGVVLRRARRVAVRQLAPQQGRQRPRHVFRHPLPVFGVSVERAYQPRDGPGVGRGVAYAFAAVGGGGTDVPVQVGREGQRAVLVDLIL